MTRRDFYRHRLDVFVSCGPSYEAHLIGLPRIKGIVEGGGADGSAVEQDADRLALLSDDDVANIDDCA